MSRPQPRRTTSLTALPSPLTFPLSVLAASVGADEYESGKRMGEAGCEVDRTQREWCAGYLVCQATMRDTEETIGGQTPPWTAKIRPGKSVTFGFTAQTTSGPGPAPELFALNGAACA